MNTTIVKGLGFWFPKRDKYYSGSDHEKIAQQIISENGENQEFKNSGFKSCSDYVVYKLSGVKFRNDSWQRAIVVTHTTSRIGDVRKFLEDYEMLGFRIQKIK